MKPIPLLKQTNSTIDIDENAILSIVNQQSEEPEIQNSSENNECDNTALQGDLGDLIRSLQPGQQFTLTGNTA